MNAAPSTTGEIGLVLEPLSASRTSSGLNTTFIKSNLSSLNMRVGI